MVTLDYQMDMSLLLDLNTSSQFEEELKKKKLKPEELIGTHKFRLSYYPHRLAEFTQLLKDIFGQEASHQVYGDFKELGEIENPAYYIHVIKKPLS